MQTNNESVFVENLRRLMAERELSAQKLSYAAQIPPSRISQLLSGATRNPTLGTLSALAKGLDVSIDVLVTKHSSDDSHPTRN